MNRFASIVVLIWGLVFAGLARANPPVPTLSINDVSLDESSCGSKSFAFTVTLSKLANRPVTVNYATSDGSPGGGGTAAVADKDYVPVSGKLTFTHHVAGKGPNGTYLFTITVPLGNYVVSSGTSGERAFTLSLSGPTNAIIAKAQGAGTLANAALSCKPAENATCFVSFCGAATACRNVNRSATATPWCELSEGPDLSACLSAGLWRDTDNDGLSDAAEAQGYIDVNANAVYDPGIDIPLPGADPNKADVYLHYDYTWASDHDHNPPAQAIQYIVDAFAAHGVNLHIDPQHNAICENAGDAGCITAGTGAHVATLTSAGASCTDDQHCGRGAVCSEGRCVPNPACVSPSAVSPDQLRAAVPYLEVIKPAYHYMIFGHYSGCDPHVDPNTGTTYCDACPSDQEDPACGSLVSQPPQPENLGTSEVGGNDAVIATQPFVDTGIVPNLASMRLESWSGLSMHELGHNFGLMHGGSDCYNQKANYVSVMSYSFYLSGIPMGNAPGDTMPKACSSDDDCASPDHAVGGHCSTATHTCFRIDYSDRLFNDLDELGGLDETLGLQGGTNNTDISWRRTFPGFSRVATDGSPVDWNNDGAIANGVSAEVNGDAQKTFLAAQDDWATRSDCAYQGQPSCFAHLEFRYQCTSNF